MQGQCTSVLTFVNITVLYTSFLHYITKSNGLRLRQCHLWVFNFSDPGNKKQGI